MTSLCVEGPARLAAAFAAGAAVGVLGGLIGLGGAEFRLPLLLMFGFAALAAVIVNQAISLVVVSSALLFRSSAVTPAEVLVQWPTMVNLLAGSLSLAVSLPTMLVGLARYSRDRSFDVLQRSAPFVLSMTAGSVLGAALGGQALGWVTAGVRSRCL